MGTQNAYRMIAAKLATLHPRDQKWLLARFETTHANKINQLLNEVKAIGLDAQSINQWFDTSIPKVINSVQLGHEKLEAINRLDQALICKHFSIQSEKIQALLLMRHHWKWSMGVWAKLEKHKRLRIAKLRDEIADLDEELVILIIDSFFKFMQIENIEKNLFNESYFEMHL